MARFKSPEESGPSGKLPRGGAPSRSEGGFAEGEFGRGPTPYKRSHSSKPNGHPADAHLGTAGRGAPGVFGKADGFKGASADVAHPQSHAEFENLGTSSDE